MGNGPKESRIQMNTISLDSVKATIQKSRSGDNTIYFGQVGRGTKFHIVRKFQDMHSVIYSLCGAETSTTMNRRPSYLFTVSENEVPESALCNRCIGSWKAGA
jgi:hypothetical protein